jgi:hypothetical protein
VAVTDFTAFMFTMHVAPEDESHPLQVTSRLGVAVSVTTVLIVNVSEQSVPQLMPAGLELTLPRALPRPALLTVSTNCFRSKLAVTLLGSFIVTAHVVPDAVSHPLQPVKFEVLDGLAVNDTLVPTLKSSEQSVPQLMPAGVELTVPVPPPAGLTVSVTGARTVRVVLAVAPVLSVAVIVVVPALTAVARPDASTVATAVLLLVHVSPVPLIMTGVEEAVVVPLPNWPQSFAPQHQTLALPRSTQLWWYQPLVRDTAPAIPDTGPGVDELVAVPLPS